MITNKEISRFPRDSFKHLYTDLLFGYYELVKLKSVINPVLRYYIQNIIYKKKRLLNKINIIYDVHVIYFYF